MEPHFTLTDVSFEQQFETSTLNPDIFSHEAHLRLAYIHIKKYGINTALINIPQQLKAYVTAIGAEAKYNHTLTIAAIHAVAHFIKKSSSHNFQDFIVEFPQLKTQFKQLIRTHYSVDIFNAADAKYSIMEPDLAPFG